jgi:hypothetical protein
MFYCNDCAESKNLDRTLHKSHGQCEVCKKYAICNDGKISDSKCPNCTSLQNPVNIDYLGDQKYQCPNCITKQAQLDKLYQALKKISNTEHMSLVSQIVELEIDLELESNQ